MRGGRPALAWLAALGAILGTLACAPLGLGGTTPPSRFYLLTPLEAPPQRTDGPRLGVGEIRIADYLDRPQIVTRQGENRLELAEFDRWGEPLGDSIARVMMENLGSLLETQRVQQAPWRDPSRVDLRLELDIERFDGPAGGPVELVAHWQLSRGSQRVERITRVSEDHPGPGYEGQVAAMSRALQRLCREIAAALPAAPAS
jgi:uncharacterized lipoprotein YmbA